MLAGTWALVLHQPILPSCRASGLIEMSILYCCDCTINTDFGFCFPKYLSPFISPNFIHMDFNT